MSSPWTRASAYHWRHTLAPYFVERSRVGDEWIYLAWHKRPRKKTDKDAPIAECISPERRLSFEAAAADCAAHCKQAKRGMHHDGERQELERREPRAPDAARARG
jgi:hypothetical protein